MTGKKEAEAAAMTDPLAGLEERSVAPEGAPQWEQDDPEGMPIREMLERIERQTAPLTIATSPTVPFAVTEPSQERVAVAFVDCLFYKGAEWHPTIRAGATVDDILALIILMERFTDEILEREDWCISGKITMPVEAGDAPPAGASREAPAANGAGPADSPEAGPPPRKGGGKSAGAAAGLADGEMRVTQLSKHVQDDKEFYRVYGGRYVKYGVRCWPEVAVRFNELMGIALDKMKSGAKYDLAKYDLVAHFILNDKGQPNKVDYVRGASDEPMHEEEIPY